MCYELIGVNCAAIAGLACGMAIRTLLRYVRIRAIVLHRLGLPVV